MAHSIHALPPKVAAQYAERARRGEGLHHGAECYEFLEFGNQCVELVSLNPPIGHVMKISQAAADELRARIDAARAEREGG